MGEANRKTCELCERDGGRVLWRDARLRVVYVADPHYPGFCRVIWNAHVAEMTDLGARGRAHLMRVVFAVEAVLRALLRPAKINLASLGNVTPHLHWHVIPRRRDDPHYPGAIWSAPLRRRRRPRARNPAAAIARALARRLGRPQARPGREPGT
ncbi:MAG TPA: HIT family protein [Burkholderiales bacterium]|nr:HIT family protein [Burkholderiales bacterium]